MSYPGDVYLSSPYCCNLPGKCQGTIIRGKDKGILTVQRSGYHSRCRGQRKGSGPGNAKYCRTAGVMDIDGEYLRTPRLGPAQQHVRSRALLS